MYIYFFLFSFSERDRGTLILRNLEVLYTLYSAIEMLSAHKRKIAPSWKPTRKKRSTFAPPRTDRTTGVFTATSESARWVSIGSSGIPGQQSIFSLYGWLVTDLPNRRKFIAIGLRGSNVGEDQQAFREHESRASPIIARLMKPLLPRKGSRSKKEKSMAFATSPQRSSPYLRVTHHRASCSLLTALVLLHQLRLVTSLSRYVVRIFHRSAKGSFSCFSRFFRRHFTI